MKLTIRYDVYQTNSSTSHSLIIMPSSIYKKWRDNDTLYYFDGYDEDKQNGPKTDTLYTFDEVKDFLINVFEWKESYFECPKGTDEYDFEYELRNEIGDVGFYTFESWNGGDWAMEEDTTYYTTENGDKIAIRAKYGRDG